MPRLTNWALISIVLLLAIAYFSFEQLPVVIYKCALVTLAAVLGYWLDRALFPYARPHRLFEDADRQGARHYDEGRDRRINASLATLRRAVVILACVLGLTLGL